MKEPKSFMSRKFAGKVLLGAGLLLGGVLAVAGGPLARVRSQAAATDDASTLLEGYRHVEVASVSDALRATDRAQDVHVAPHEADLSHEVCGIRRDGPAEEGSERGSQCAEWDAGGN